MLLFIVGVNIFHAISIGAHYYPLWTIFKNVKVKGIERYRLTTIIGTSDHELLIIKLFVKSMNLVRGTILALTFKNALIARQLLGTLLTDDVLTIFALHRINDIKCTHWTNIILVYLPNNEFSQAFTHFSYSFWFYG